MDSIVSLLRLVLISMVPFALASQGTMFAGRTGIFIVAQEGIMLTGASVGFIVSYMTGGNNWLGGLAAVIVGGIFGAVTAYFSVKLKMNQFVIGLSLLFIGIGLSTLIPKIVIGITLTQPLIPTLQNLPIPLLHQIPLIGPVLFNHNILVYLSILISVGFWYFLFRTQKGLEMRAVGENPMAADSLGINTVRNRYLAAIIGGALIALAGAYLPMVYTGTFTELMTRGRGWLSIALTFFGGWSPMPIFWGSLFFSAIDVASISLQTAGFPIPYQYLLMVPYLATILVMVFTFGKARVPGFLGMNYDRENRNL